LHGITADPRPLQGSASYLPSPFEFLVQHHEAPHVAYDFGAVGPGKGPQRLREIRLVRLAECDLERIPLVAGAPHLGGDHPPVHVLYRAIAQPRLDHRFARYCPRMQGAAHSLADHVEEACRLSGDEHVALAEYVAVDERRAEVLAAALVLGVRGEAHAVLFFQVAHHVLVPAREVVAALEAHAHDLAAVARMAPGVVPEGGMEPEMEIIRVERAVDDVVELLAHEEPGNLLGIV